MHTAKPCSHIWAVAGELEKSVRAWLGQPGPPLLHVKVTLMQLVMPPSPLVSPEAVVGIGVYTAKAMLQGKDHDVCEMMVENICDDIRRPWAARDAGSMSITSHWLKNLGVS